jgi:hypothetical protein
MSPLPPKYPLDPKVNWQMTCSWFLDTLRDLRLKSRYNFPELGDLRQKVFEMYVQYPTKGPRLVLIKFANVLDFLHINHSRAVNHLNKSNDKYELKAWIKAHDEWYEANNVKR